MVPIFQIIIICIVLCQHQLKSDYKVSVSVKQNVIVIGEDVDMQCSTVGNFEKKTRQWVKVSDFTVISVNELITKDRNKYSQKLVFLNDTLIIFTLTIRNFTEFDFNTYRCIYGAKEAEIALDMIDNYIYMPDNNTTVRYHYYHSNNSIDVDVRMPKVYPKPLCWIFTQVNTYENNEMQAYVFAENKIGKFYNVTIKRSFLIGQEECGYVAVACLIGSRMERLKPNYEINSIKGDNDRNQRPISNRDNTVLVVTIIAIVVVVVYYGCGLIVIIIWLKYKKKKTSEDNIPKGNGIGAHGPEETALQTLIVDPLQSDM